MRKNKWKRACIHFLIINVVSPFISVVSPFISVEQRNNTDEFLF